MRSYTGTVWTRTARNRDEWNGNRDYENEKRRRGRRWRDDIRSYEGTVWTRTARNRNEWNGNQGQGKGEEDGGMT